MCSPGSAALHGRDREDTAAAVSRERRASKAEAAAQVKALLHLLYACEDISREQFRQAARSATHALQSNTGAAPASVVQAALQDLGVYVPMSRLVMQGASSA